MNNQLPYNAWLHFEEPATDCNFSCAYCNYNTSRSVYDIFKKRMYALRNRFSALNIPAISQSLEKTNKTFKVSFSTKGEPFLTPNLAEFCIEIAKKHFLAFNTNLTSTQIEKISKNIPASRILYIIASVHHQELLKKKLLDKFIHNYNLCRNAGYNITALEVAFPPFMEKATQLKQFFTDIGIDLKFTHYIGNYQGKIYPNSYTTEELNIFGLTITKETLQSYQPQSTICNAGYNAAIVDKYGAVYPCGENKTYSLGNINKGFFFKSSMTNCVASFCSCPLKEYDQLLFKQASDNLSQTKS